MGRNSLVTPVNTEFLIQYTIRADRANDGLAPSSVIENTLQLHPELTYQQAKNFTARTFKLKAKGRLKSRPVKAQKTTSKRSQCTVKQQFRWFTNVAKAYAFLGKMNTGQCRKTGLQFGEMIDHFIVGADETCMISDSAGQLKCFGEKGRKKHKKNVSERR